MHGNLSLLHQHQCKPRHSVSRGRAASSSFATDLVLLFICLELIACCFEFIDIKMSSADSKDIQCPICHIIFTAKKNLYKHMRKFHPSENVDVAGKQICAMCSENFRTISELHDHIQQHHEDINLVFNQEVFNCRSDFEAWKVKMEEESQASFVSPSGNKELADGTRVMYYVCHRSGLGSTIQNRKRKQKFGGSIKLGCSCPANLIVYFKQIEEAEEIMVKYQSTHMGHRMEVGKLPIPKGERIRLAGLLRKGIPKTRILSDLHKDHQPTKRIGIINRQDLHNISRDFKIDEVIMDANDAVSVDLKVKKLQEDADNPVLLYKSLMNNINQREIIRSQEQHAIVHEIKKNHISDIEKEKKAFISNFQTFALNIDNTDKMRILKEGFSTMKARVSALIESIPTLPSDPSQFKKSPATKINGQKRFDKRRKWKPDNS